MAEARPPLLLGKLADVWPAIRRAHLRIDCCINATRIWLEAIKILMPHASAKPLSVRAITRNAEARRLMDETPDFTEADWKASGARLVDVGAPEEIYKNWPNAPRGAAAGHLVIVFNGKFLVDPSAEQMARPKLLVPDVVIAPVHQRFLTGKGVLSLEIPGDGELIYEAKPKDHAFLDFPGYQMHEGNARVLVDLLNATRN